MLTNLFDSKKAIILYTLLAVALARGVIYMSIIPPFQAPDEPAHFIAMEIYEESGHMPRHADYAVTPLDTDFINALYETGFWQHRRVAPPDPAQFYYDKRTTYVDLPGTSWPISSDHKIGGYFHLVVPLYRLYKSHDRGEGILPMLSGLYVLRFLSVLMYAAAVAAAWAVGFVVFPNDGPLALSVPALAAFLPMGAATGSVVNADAMAMMLGALFLLGVVLAVERDGAWWWLLASAGLLAWGIIVKRTMLFGVPALAVAAAIALSGRVGISPKKQALFAGGLLAGTVACLAAATLVPAMLIPYYKTFPILIWIRATLNPPAYSRGVLALFSPATYSPERLALYGAAFQVTSATAWGDFGWANVPLPWSLLKAFMYASLLSVVGAALFIYRSLREKRRRDALTVLAVAAAAAVGMAFAPLLIAGELIYAPHARYVLPTLPALAVFFLAGLRELVPARLAWRRFVPPGVVCIVALLDVYSITHVILPYYYSW